MYGIKIFVITSFKDIPFTVVDFPKSRKQPDTVIPLSWLAGRDPFQFDSLIKPIKVIDSISLGEIFYTN